jgi:peptidoglycan/LPS O-acetylase OafA/YrhL
MKSIFNNLKYLHIVRGLAALVVVVFHAKFVFWVGGVIYKNDKGLHGVWDYALFGIDMLSSCGEQCVIVFFILSAFVIRHSFDKYKNNLAVFYKLRLYRIYIPFLFSIVLGITVMLCCVHFINPGIYGTHFRSYNGRLTNSYDQLSFSQVVNTILLTEQKEYAGGNYAYWSLGHELVFYILFPLYFFLKRNLKVVLALLFIALFLLTGWNVFYLQVFFLGGLLLYDYFDNRSAKPVVRSRRFYFLLLGILYVAVNISIKLFPDWVADVLTFVFCFFLFDHIFYFVKGKHTALTKLGDISYTLYLTHLPLLMLFYAFITLWTGKLVFYSRLPYYAGVLFAVLCSIPLYYLVERPSITILKKIRR